MKKLMYGIKRVNSINNKAYSFLEKNIKSNFCSHFCQSDETSAKSSFLVCATWKLYKYGFCKGKCSNRCFEAEVRELINNLKVFFHANELTPWGFWKNDLNKKILMKYKALSLSNLNVSEETKKNLSCPMLIHLGLEYKPKEGVFIIGQETQNSKGESGWGTPENKFGSNYNGFEKYVSRACDWYDRESILMETQSQWLFDNMQNRMTPFFRAVKEISNAGNGADFYYKSKFVWDELIAMDYRGKGLEKLGNQGEIDEVIKYSIEKLTSELQLAEPKYAIFFTGFKGVYKKALDQLFGQNVDMMPKYNDNNDIKYFKWNNKVECFLTDHPRTLQLDGRWNVVTKLSKIVNK